MRPMDATPFSETSARAPSRPKRRLASRLYPWVLLAFAGVRAVNLAVVQLPFNGWDELSHIAVAYYVREYGRMPMFLSPMPRDLKPFVEAHPHPSASLAMLRDTTAKPYPGGDPACGVEPPRRHRMTLYEAQHGPLYYHVMALFPAGPDPRGLLAWADTGRILNIALLLGTLFLWRRILLRVVPRDGPLAWLPDGVMLLLVSFSYVPYNFVRFANDALALFLGAAALAFYLERIKPNGQASPRQVWRWGLLGAVTGGAVLAKATSLILMPVFAAVLAWRCLAGRRQEVLGALACLAVFLLGYAALAGPYHVECLLRYGQLTGMQEAVMNGFRGFGPGRLLEAAGEAGCGLIRNLLLYNCTPHQAGWSNLIAPQWINLGFKTLVTVCGAAFCAGMARGDARRLAGKLLVGAPEMTLLLAFGTAALVFHAAHSILCWGVPTTGPWYGMLFLPVLFLLLLLGPSLWGRRTSACCLLFLVLLCNGAYMAGTYGDLLTQETNLADFYKALKAVAAHHALLRLDLHTSLVAEFLLLMLAVSLAFEEALDLGERAKTRVTLFVAQPPGRSVLHLPPGAAVPLQRPGQEEAGIPGQGSLR